MKIKIEIKHWVTGSLLFEYESENNTILKTLQKAVEGKKDLRGADLRGADLTGADLTGADLTGAYLRGDGEKINNAAVFDGLYDYIVIPYITDKDEKRVKMGCYDRSLKEWEENFWNNDNEFPNNNSIKSNLRMMAFEAAKKWFEIIEKYK